ncbi:RHS repeat-associated core domain-containing protein [Colwellia sp. E2M01]|uniref:RHS repeat domain-containing protein n=1 Tax=Colwellia sp. E2M01 TaxID=2841561 RepID=UPI001C0A3CE7|nr:RHS repeat-associated core domain-containing protein [Colwellia sp. E2M01]MBU2870413.1 RHS repeat-associated core domain-containing protein [Colwellia sp. E2M01]
MKIKPGFVKANYDDTDGWHNGHNCSSDAPSIFVDAYTSNLEGYEIAPASYWQGILLNIPGVTSEKFLKTSLGSLQTKSNFKVIECIDAGDGEQGMKVAAPDGSIYTFGQIKSYDVDSQVMGAMNNSSPTRTHAKLLLLTNVTDRFGNYVEYHYATNGELRGIISSDERIIEITSEGYTNRFGQAKTRATSASAEGKTWVYNHNEDTGYTGQFLSEVILPSQLTWEYSPSLYRLAYDPDITGVYYRNILPIMEVNCPTTVPEPEGSWEGVVKSPAGADIKYTFASTYHGRSNVSASPSYTAQIMSHPSPNGYIKVWLKTARNNNCQRSSSLQSLEISGALLPTKTWTYEYSLNVGTFDDEDLNDVHVGNPTPPLPHGLPSSIDDAENIRTVTIEGPESHIRYYIDREFQSISEGMVVVTDTLSANGSMLLERKESHYEEGPKVGTHWFIPAAYNTTSALENAINGSQIQHRILLNKDVTRLYYEGSTTSDEYTTEYIKYDALGLLEEKYEHNSFSNKKRSSKYSYLQEGNITDNGIGYQVIGLPLTEHIKNDQGIYELVDEVVYHSDDNSGLYTDLYLPYQYKRFGTWVTQYSEYFTGASSLAAGKIKKIEQPIPLVEMNGMAAYQQSGTLRYQLYSDYKRGVAQKVEVPVRWSHRGTKREMNRYVDGLGNITGITDFNGNSVSYHYDDASRLTVMNLPDNWLDTHITWDTQADGNQQRTAIRCIYNGYGTCNSADNFSAISSYDARYRVVTSEVTDNIQTNSQFFEFDSEHNPTFASYNTYNSAESEGTTTKYDALGRTVSTYTSNGGTVHYRYLSGNKIRVTDGENNITTTTYLAYGSPAYSQALVTASPEEVTTTQTINAFGEVTAITQGGNGLSQTEYRAYDANHHLCKVSRNDVGTTVYTNNILGEMTSQASGVGGGSVTNCDSNANESNTINFQYDNLGTLYKIDYPDDSLDVVRVSDHQGRLTKLYTGFKNASYITKREYEYNKINLLEKESLTVNNKTFTLDYHYNPAGHLKGLTYPNGDYIDYGVNAFGQTKSATRKISGQADYNYATNAHYYASGSIDGFTYGNGLVHKTELNNRKLPASILDSKAGTTALSYSYEYDFNNNVTSLVDNIDDSFSINTLQYDGLDRLTNTIGGVLSSYIAYDTLGNIETYNTTERNLTYHYDDNNRLASVDSSGTKPKSYSRFDYDSRGNVEYNGHRSFTFNLANQLKDSGQSQYVYDAENRRVQSTHATKGISYSFYTQSGRLIYRETPKGGINYIFLGDRLIAKDGVIPENASKQHYQPLGGSVEGEKDDVGYTGHKFDTDLELSYMQARYYDPVIGRFLSNDPVGYIAENPVMSFNRYMYVNNNPYKYTDPDGKLLFMAFFGPSLITAAADIAIGVGLYKAGSAMSDYQGKAVETQQLNLDVKAAVDAGNYKEAFSLNSKAESSTKELVQMAGETAETVASNIPGNSASGPIPSSKVDAAVTVINSAIGAATSEPEPIKEAPEVKEIDK